MQQATPAIPEDGNVTSRLQIMETGALYSEYNNIRFLMQILLQFAQLVQQVHADSGGTLADSGC
jgi:hypothetical protein